MNTYKLNIDACFFLNGTGARGAVIRNDRGEAIAGSSNSLINIADASSAEAIALQHGLLLAEKIGCSPLIF